MFHHRFPAGQIPPCRRKDPNHPYKVAQAVASITTEEGTTKYATLREAVQAATADQTVTLLADVTEAIVNTNTNAFTMDLNGHTWTSADTTATLKNSSGAGTITITDVSTEKTGKIQNTATNGVAVLTEGTASVIITDGIFDSAVTATTITGGTFHSAVKASSIANATFGEEAEVTYAVTTADDLDKPSGLRC